MIQITAGGINLHEYIPRDGYSIKITPKKSDNSFTDCGGKVIAPVQGYQTEISCRLTKVPHAAAEAIAKVVQAESFELTYTTPITITNEFRCTAYNAEPKNPDPRQKNPLITDNITWDISMTMESTDTAVTDGDGL